jgi:hypothetical protein
MDRRISTACCWRAVFDGPGLVYTKANRERRNRHQDCKDLSDRNPPVHTYSFMFFLAYFKAASGVALPLVAISNAAFITLQNLPI